MEAEQRLEEGWVQVVAVIGMCGLKGEAPPEEAARGNPRELLLRVLVGEGRWGCEGTRWQSRAAGVGI